MYQESIERKASIKDTFDNYYESNNEFVQDQCLTRIAYALKGEYGLVFHGTD